MADEQVTTSTSPANLTPTAVAPPAPTGTFDATPYQAPKPTGTFDSTPYQAPAQKPSIMDHVNKLASYALEATPLGPLHDAADAVQKWAAGKTSPENPHMLSPAATAGLGAVRDTAGLVSGATSPAGVATIGAGIVAPEVVGPLMVAHGVHNVVEGWGDLKNPDVLQQELNSAAEVVGGAASTGEAFKPGGGGPMNLAVRRRMALKNAAKAPDEQLTAFKQAIPQSKAAPYEDADVQAARPYLEAEHNGANPIDSPVGFRDAANAAVEKIEAKVSEAIKSDPTRTIKTNPLADARQTLKGSVRKDFEAAGLKELDNYFTDGQPITLQQADDIRAQLNQENKATLLRNNYDLHTARTTDPAFSAREAAAKSLRTGVYDELEEMGFKDMRAIRLDEGSLLKLRNASLRQEYNGERGVSGTESPVRKKVAGAVKAGGRMVGAGVGAHAGGSLGAVGGEAAGGLIADKAADLISPGKLTHNALLKKAFGPAPGSIPQGGVTGANAASAATEGAAANNGNIYFRASDGSEHAIPDNPNALAHAKSIDPGLQLIP